LFWNRETYKTINEVKAAFRKFDKNSDGSLSKTEVARMMYRWAPETLYIEDH
jgi:Ca2+-binding EF-hand superfamily protein